ncbi:MAG: Rrf2 family transcriptional regulator [Burkholderiales bacterium]|nr:Rrf2 family transcriptional regulator [Burkholderiales bacterium]
MRLQKNTLFALYSVLESAANPGRQFSAGGVARKYGISPHHLAKVLRTLGRAGLVESVRGVGGGYRFRGNAKRLTLMDVVRLFENVVAPAPRAGARRPAVERGVATILAEIDAMAGATLQSISIDTMVKLIERQQRRAPPGP